MEASRLLPNLPNLVGGLKPSSCWNRPSASLREQALRPGVLRALDGVTCFQAALRPTLVASRPYALRRARTDKCVDGEETLPSLPRPMEWT